MSIYSDSSFIISAAGGYKEGGGSAGKLYNLKPDGATYPAMDVTGGGNAVSQRSDGTWQINWPANTPRFKWNDGVPSILVESQRQNLIVDPRSFVKSSWSKTGAKIEGDPTTTGSELITNAADREFSSDTGFWSKTHSGITISGGTANWDGTQGNGQGLSRSNILEVGKLYIVEYEIVELTAGSINVYAGYYPYGATYGKLGINRVYLIPTITALHIFGNANTVGKIDNVSVKEVSGFSCPFVDSSGVNTLEGFKLVEDTSTSEHRVTSGSISLTAGQKYTFSVFAKKAERGWIRLAVFGVANTRVWYNLNTGQVGTSQSLVENPTITLDADNYYKLQFTYTATSTGIHYFAIFNAKQDNEATYTGDGTSGVYICHAQLEQASTASSPIYGAEGSALTRLADELSEVDLTGIKTLIINDYALISETGFVYNSYELDPTRTYSRIITSESVMTEAQLTAIGAVQVASTDAVAGDLFVHNGYIYGAVESATGKLWLDRNLGAKRVAQSSTDTEAYGDLYQWGRAADGHEIINRFVGDGKTTSGTTVTLADSDTPAHDDFILAPNSPNDWRNPQNDSLWQGVDGINNPAPDGWRLPTETEWNAEIAIFTSANSAGAYASVMKLPMAGRRNYNNGSFGNVGSIGYYWSATVVGAYARYLYFDSSNANVGYYNRANGLSVRCLKN